MIGCFRVVLAFKASVAASGVFSHASQSLFGFWGGPEKPGEAKLDFVICCGTWINGDRVDSVYPPFPKWGVQQHTH